MNPKIALYTLSVLTVLTIWNCLVVFKKLRNATKKKDKATLKKDLKNSVIGTAVIILITLLSWVL